LNLKQHIPNAITLGNLSCGFAAILFAMDGQMLWAFLLILTGGFLDFFDGMAARLLKVSGALGAQLDSLSDLITFGAAPAVMVFVWLDTATGYNLNQLIQTSHRELGNLWMYKLISSSGVNIKVVLVCLIPVACGAIRLAKFNISKDQSSEFKGLAIPAAGIFLASLPIATEWFFLNENDIMVEILMNKYLITSIVLVFGGLMVSNFPMFSLKLQSLRFKEYPFQFMLLLIFMLAIVLGMLIKNIWISIPIIVVLYILLSLVKNLLKR